jgi:hypothetical protein
VQPGGGIESTAKVGHCDIVLSQGGLQCPFEDRGVDDLAEVHQGPSDRRDGQAFKLAKFARCEGAGKAADARRRATPKDRELNRLHPGASDHYVEAI